MSTAAPHSSFGEITVDVVYRPSVARPAPGELSKQQSAAALQLIQRRRARAAAEEAEFILRLAELCPDTEYPPPDFPGAKKTYWRTGNSVPGTFAALTRGKIDERRAQELFVVLGHAPIALARRVRRGQGANPPAPTDRYTPSAEQREFLRTRDRICRMPNCGARTGWADHDHVIAHSCGGETTCTDLCCLCRTHHRLKTFAKGWIFEMEPDGTLHVTTPSGITRTSRPWALRRRPPPQPPEPDPPPF
jgi:hypothetical protein